MKKKTIKLILIVLGLAVFGGGGYLTVNKLAEYKIDKAQQEELQTKEKEQLQAQVASTTAEIENLKKELGGVKAAEQKRTSEAQKITNSKLSNAEIIAKNKPAVVYIQTSSGSGSGMIIDSNGTILTNAHVVLGVQNATIKFSDSRQVAASVVGRDENLDVAILKISGANYPYVEFGDSSSVQQGDDVFTLGFPFGLEGEVSFKEGTVSRRLVNEGASYIEISAEIHGGNSGGPLVNIRGQVIGINTAQYGLQAEGVLLGETLKLAIPINNVQPKLAQLKAGTENLKWLASRAYGTMTIFNDTDIPQRFIRNTRFESPNGKIFRIPQSVTIPAKTGNVPGSITSTVFADTTGPEYNIPPTNFTVPGFKGTDRYNLFYGRSYQPMSGGN